MVDWLNGFVIPLIEITIILGIVGYFSYVVIKAFWNGYSKSFKFFFKYKILRKKYPEETVRWIMNCLEQNIGYYGAMKMLMINMTEKDSMNEILYIFRQIIKEYTRQKGGMNRNGR